jgi:hypothetical protein
MKESSSGGGEFGRDRAAEVAAAVIGEDEDPCLSS